MSTTPHREGEFDVIVIGGGPAGATVAGFLAQRGRRVLVLEAARFPRYHIGESLIPGGIHVLRELGVLERIDRYGFIVKQGNTYVWGKNPTPWSIAFAEADIDVYAYQVVRSEFDEILLRHARDCGAVVREGQEVRDLLFDSKGICTGVVYADPSGKTRKANAPWTVDASGQACIVGRRLNLRRIDPVLKNVAIWSYFRNAERLPDPESGFTLSASVSDGWIWVIPLHNGTTSVGLVMGIEALRRARRRTLRQVFESRIASSELVTQLLRRATQCDRLFTTRDWSYCCKRFTGPGWILVGDAAGFVDPILSTGCGLALQAGYVAAKALDACLSDSSAMAPMVAFESFYQGYIGQFFDFVHYFYDANRHRDSYYWQARRLLTPTLNATARNAFIHLVSGLNNSATTDGPRRRSFEMGVFENLGTPIGGHLLELLDAKQGSSVENGCKDSSDPTGQPLEGNGTVGPNVTLPKNRAMEN